MYGLCVSVGMPYPQNLSTALEVEQVIRDHDAVPATIAIIGGHCCVGKSRCSSFWSVDNYNNNNSILHCFQQQACNTWQQQPSSQDDLWRQACLFAFCMCCSSCSYQLPGNLVTWHYKYCSKCSIDDHRHVRTHHLVGYRCHLPGFVTCTVVSLL